MKNYDYAKAKRFIEAHKSEIKCASMGMDEDWFWTAETVFEDGEYRQNLDDTELELGGINGSSWATPILEVEYKDGTIEKYNCYVGDSDNDCPDSFMLGCLSSPVQDSRKEQIRLEIED